MVNPWTGEVALTVNGQAQRLKLTLGALAELEAELTEGTLLDLVERCETGVATVSDIWSLIVAGLRGGGWRGSRADLLQAEVEGGVPAASKAAAALLVRAFSLPETGG